MNFEPHISNFLSYLTKQKTPILITIIVLYITGVLYLFPKVGIDACKLNLIPIVYASFFLGYRGGFIIFLTLNIFLISYFHITDVPLFSYQKQFLLGIFFNFLMVILFGSIAKLYLKTVTLNRKLKENSLCDSLTGLHNRRYFQEVVTGLAKNFREEVTNKDVWRRDPDLKDKIMGICMIDIDFFKTVNDTYGHDAGDIVLFEISKLLRSLTRFDDIVVRWGGEEFLILLNKTRIEYLPQFLESLKTGIKKMQIAIDDSHSITISLSGGCIAYPCPSGNLSEMTFEDYVHLADSLLYFAKNSGRNRLVLLKCVKNKVTPDEIKKLFSSIHNREKEIENYVEII